MRANRREPRETFREAPPSVVVPHFGNDCRTSDKMLDDDVLAVQQDASREIRNLVNHYQTLGPTRKAYSDNTEKYLSRQRDIWIQ